MVARDYGAAVAADAARLAVAPLHRSGGQAQFIVRNRLTANGIAEQSNSTTCWRGSNEKHTVTSCLVTSPSVLR